MSCHWKILKSTINKYYRELFKLNLTLRFVRMFLDEPHGEDFKVRFRIEDESIAVLIKINKTSNKTKVISGKENKFFNLTHLHPSTCTLLATVTSHLFVLFNCFLHRFKKEPSKEECPSIRESSLSTIFSVKKI